MNALVLRQKMEELSKLRNEITDLEGEKKKFESFFLKENEAVPLLRLLEKIAAEAGCVIKINPVDINKIKFEKAAKSGKSEKSQDDEEDIKKQKSQGEDQKKETETEKKDDLASVKKYPAFLVEAEGAYGSLVIFLRKMENLPYFIRVLVLDIAPGGETSQVTPGSDILRADSRQESGSQPSGGRNIKMSITFVVYGN